MSVERMRTKTTTTAMRMLMTKTTTPARAENRALRCVSSSVNRVTAYDTETRSPSRLHLRRSAPASSRPRRASPLCPRTTISSAAPLLRRRPSRPVATSGHRPDPSRAGNGNTSPTSTVKSSDFGRRRTRGNCAVASASRSESSRTRSDLPRLRSVLTSCLASSLRRDAARLQLPPPETASRG